MPISRKVQEQISKASWIRRMFEEGRVLKKRVGSDNVFDFSLGNPILEPPEEFFEALDEAAAERRPGLHQYMENVGFRDVRQAIADRHALESGLDLLEQINGSAGPSKEASKEVPSKEVPALQALFVAADFCRQHQLARLSPSEGELFSDRELRHFLARHRRDAWPVEPRVTTGTVEAEILDRIEEWCPDLVILGTHGRGGFERFLLGSVAATVAREGTSNTLVIPPQAAREAVFVEEELRSVAV